MSTLVIKEKKKMELLSRTSIIAELEFSGATPKNTQVLEILAKALSADAKLLYLNSVKTIQGTHKAVINAYLYDSKDAKDALVRVAKKETEEAEKSQVSEVPKEEATLEEKKPQESEE